jgi:DNA-binding beta-propeller fold protein YncE
MTKKRWHAVPILLALAAAACTYVEPDAAPLAGARPAAAPQAQAPGGGGGLVGNNGARLTATVTGSLRGPLASLVANNAGNLVGNHAAGLVGNHAASYALAALADWTEPVADVDVALYDDQGRALTNAAVKADAAGQFRIDGVETTSPVLFVRAKYRLADQDLDLAAALPAPKRGESRQVPVDPATTLVGKKVEQLIATGKLEAAKLGEETISSMVHGIAPLMTEKTVVAAAILGPEQAAAAFDALIKANPSLSLELRKKADADPALPALVGGADVLGVVSTLAGAEQGYRDGKAADARFNSPYDVVIDGRGGLYVSDYGNNCIRRVDLATGDVGTIAGGLEGGFADGSGGLARFRNPRGLALDARDPLHPVLYVADTGNARVRKVVLGTGGAPAEVSTVAGGELPGFADGDGAAARFKDPRGLALDGQGHLYVADAGNQRVREIDLETATRPVTTVARLGDQAPAGQLAGPFGLAFRPDGRLLVADATSDALLALVPADGVTVTLAGGAQGLDDGTGIAARFRFPAGLAPDGGGGAYVADLQNHVVRHVGPQAQVTTLAGDGTAGFADGTGAEARFHNPTGLALAGDGKLYVADAFNHRIRVVAVP